MVDKPSMDDQFQKVHENNKRDAEYIKKQKEIWHSRIDNEYNRIHIRQKIANKNASINLNKIDSNKINKIIQSNQEYLKLAKNSYLFLNNPDFQGKIPFFAKNIILVAATTGDGKSTTSSNLAYHAIMQGQRVLIITNEECVSDVYNNITCLVKGWSYTNHESFTPEQTNTFDRFIKHLSNRVTVIDDSFNGEIGQTTTIEGITGILDSLIKNESKFDLIIFDYYQNVYASILDPNKQPWQVQEDFCRYLNTFRTTYPAPIVILAQKRYTKEDDQPLKDSLEGRKMILNISTCAIEMKADRENFRTKWIIKKSRFNQFVGQTISTGFDRGKYILYDMDFISKIETVKIQKQNNKLMGLIKVNND